MDDNSEPRPTPAMRSGNHTLIRRLALAKLRELRQAGMSFHEIVAEFDPARVAPRVVVDRPGASPIHGSQTAEPSTPGSGSAAGSDHVVFLRTLDALEQQVAFFDCSGRLLHTSQMLSSLLTDAAEGERLRLELEQFAGSLGALVHLRELEKEELVIKELAVREVPTTQRPYRLRGSYIGLDLFGNGSSLLITLEDSASERLSPRELQARFGLSKRESRIAYLLADGRSNAEIAHALFISPNTARTHTQRIRQKLGVHSRAEIASKILKRRGH